MTGNGAYTPFISPSAYIHPSAVIIGNVRIGRNVFIGPNAVIRADEADGENIIAPVIIEDDVNIQDNAVIHALEGSTARIGKGASISHSAVVHGPCDIGSNCFIGFNSVVFKAEIGNGTVVMHQTVIENCIIPENRSVPSGSIIRNNEDTVTLETVTEELSAFASKVRKNNQKLIDSPIYKNNNQVIKYAQIIQKKQGNPMIAVVMGSHSDMDTMKSCIDELVSFEIPHEVRIISAHRTPDKVHAFASDVYDRGIRVIIAAAGKAAHLAGVMASLTIIPVIGVPMQTSDLGGLDSLLSTVQMPGGIPVATTAIGKAGARNAALLAVSILALNEPVISSRLKEYRKAMQHDVEKMDSELFLAAV